MHLLPARAVSLVEWHIEIGLEAYYMNCGFLGIMGVNLAPELRETIDRIEQATEAGAIDLYGDKVRRQIRLLELREMAVKKAMRRLETSAREIADKQQNIIRLK